ncbi:hypothetical protein LCGC14_1080690, partial [marine sediment metagenome]
MSEIHDHLIKLADHLDSLGKPDCADKIDTLIKSASLSKVAQYVGVIGYVLKQNRAMGNCIRKKRVTSNSSMQDVVLECLSEYQDGQSYGNNEWTAKYAQVIKQGPDLFGNAHLYFISALGYESKIPEHIANVQKIDETLREEGIEDAIISKILSNVDTLGNILQKEANLPFPFKVAAPQSPRGRWSRFWNPSETSWNPLSWSKGQRQRGQNLDTMAEMDQLLEQVMGIITTGRSLQSSINRLKGMEGYLSGKISGINKRQITPILQAIQSLDPTNWSANLRVLQNLGPALEKIKATGDPNLIQIVDRATQLTQEISSGVKSIYTNLETAQNTMQTLRQREPLAGRRDFSGAGQGTLTSDVFGTLQEVLDYISQNPLD